MAKTYLATKQADGSVEARGFTVRDAATNNWAFVDTTGAWDLARQGANRVRVGNGAPGVEMGAALDAYIRRVAAGIVAASALEFTEQADPAAPAANKGRFYARDNGGGKTQLVAVFPTGAVQVIATEP